MRINKILHLNFIYNVLCTLLNWKKYRPVNCFPSGHFYSPIVSEIDLDNYKTLLSDNIIKKKIEGIDLNEEFQIKLIEEFSSYYNDFPFQNEKIAKHRYHYNNDSFGYADAMCLYSFIRHFKPKRIIEIGSGYSSALMLDTKDMYDHNINITFIEPYPQLLKSLLSTTDKSDNEIIEAKIQNVDTEKFRLLEKDDILFIDSSHISKTGSDVNYILFEILPVLKEGVIIHFHDIFYPFEYPLEWIKEGRNWNENYLLKAFLSYNSKYEILLFSNYLHFHHSYAFSKMPEMKNNSGGSLWLRKTK